LAANLSNLPRSRVGRCFVGSTRKSCFNQEHLCCVHVHPSMCYTNISLYTLSTSPVLFVRTGKSGKGRFFLAQVCDVCIRVCVRASKNARAHIGMHAYVNMQCSFSKAKLTLSTLAIFCSCAPEATEKADPGRENKEAADWGRCGVVAPSLGFEILSLGFWS